MCNTSRTKRSNENFFSCKRLNKSTFMVTENDRYGEFPQIFVKVYPSAVAVIDTGCGGDPNNTQVSLVAFLETQPIAENGNAPINAHKKPYVVISTHCHYDHIGGMSDFANRPDCTIWASSHDKSFLRPGALPKNSLCDNVGMETPDYTITNWVGDGQTIMTHSGQDLNLTIYHTPGHTPDHVAIWDAEERHLFVGDTLYRQAPVFFLYGGSVLAYSETIGRLRKMVNGWNQELEIMRGDVPRAKLSCGHITNNVDASEILGDMDALLYQVVTGNVKPRNGGEHYGIKSVTYMSKDGSLGLSGCEAAFQEFLCDDDATQMVRLRNHPDEDISVGSKD